MADKIRINNKYDMQGNYEPSDSEDEYSKKEKQILTKLQKRKHESESEDEVYGFSGSGDDSDGKKDIIADSDIEGQEQSDDGLPNSKAWGKKKRSYYSTDYVDEDYGGFQGDEEDALMEEEEAKNIQKRLIEQLGEEDFSLEFFNTVVTTDDSKQDTVIRSDLSQMSKRQKLQILEKESPEFSGLVEDFKTKLTIAKDNLQPLLDLVKGGKLPQCPASKFVRTNYELILNYCTNISYYLLLKSQRINIQNHPVIKRLYQYRQMLNKMEPIYQEVIKPEIDKILTAVKNNMELHKVEEDKANNKRKSDKELDSSKNAKKLKLISSLEKDDGADTGVSDDEEEYDANDFFKDESIPKTTNESEESGFSDNDDVEDNEAKPSTSSEVIIADEVSGDKREITYQIAKNKGLTPHRKKEQRNPRVKHKLKYRKAKIRRKGAIREPRNEMSRYGGEASGIKANVKKSIKIK